MGGSLGTCPAPPRPPGNVACRRGTAYLRIQTAGTPRVLCLGPDKVLGRKPGSLCWGPPSRVVAAGPHGETKLPVWRIEPSLVPRGAGWLLATSSAATGPAQKHLNRGYRGRPGPGIVSAWVSACIMDPPPTPSPRHSSPPRGWTAAPRLLGSRLLPPPWPGPGRGDGPFWDMQVCVQCCLATLRGRGGQLGGGSAGSPVVRERPHGEEPRSRVTKQGFRWCEDAGDRSGGASPPWL